MNLQIRNNGKDFEGRRELAMGTFLIIVLLILLVGTCILTTQPLWERGNDFRFQREYAPQGAGGGTGGMTPQQALKKAL